MTKISCPCPQNLKTAVITQDAARQPEKAVSVGSLGREVYGGKEPTAGDDWER